MLDIVANVVIALSATVVVVAVVAINATVVIDVAIGDRC